MIKKPKKTDLEKHAGCNKAHPATVKSVQSGSIAEDCGIEAGDVILAVNNLKIKDILDFKFYTSDDYYTITVLKQNGDTEEVEVYNDMYEQFGAEFENGLMDKPMLCKNKCIFCFMDQLPPNVRKTMVFKDDDIRLSFLQGNYVTLTNLTDDDISRIIRLRVSPLNISIHATDANVRKLMLNNPNAGKIMDIMQRFCDGGISMNGQIVLCKGINDGDVLNKTLTDLETLYPSLQSVSIVPVGISKHRQNLFKLEKFEKQDCINVINQVQLYQERFLNKFGTRLVYLSDEFYLSAGMEIPPCEYYEDFPQIENGVGLVALLKDEVDAYLKELTQEQKNQKPSKKAIITSYIAYDFIKEFANKVKSINNNLEFEIYKIKNNFFGENITVTGLICGGDIIDQLKGKINAETILLSDCMIKQNTDLFLDDTCIPDVEKALDAKIVQVKNNGRDFVDTLLGKD